MYYWYSPEYFDLTTEHWEMFVFGTNYGIAVPDEQGDEDFERTPVPYPVVPPLCGPEPPPMYGPEQYTGGPYLDYILF